MAKRSSGGRRSRSASTRRFPRTARLNSLLTEIVAEYFERVDDDRLGLLTITGVEVDNDLNVAEVFVSVLDADSAHDAEMLEALEEHRVAVQRAIGSQTSLRKTPTARFSIDAGVRHGARVEEILASLDPEPDPSERAPSGDAGETGAGEATVDSMEGNED